MKDKLAALEVKQEVLKKEALDMKKPLVDEITTIMKAWGLACFEDANIVHVNISDGFRNNVEIRIEIAFTEGVNRVFGSDLSLDYDSNTNLLSINYGTCGRFNKNNIYQFRRIELLNKIITNINFIEARLCDVCEKAHQTYIKKLEERYELDVQISALKSSIKKSEMINVINNLCPGQKWHYRDESPIDCRVYRFTHKPIIITKITPKFVFFTANLDGGTEYKCRKETFGAHIYAKYLEIVD